MDLDSVFLLGAVQAAFLVALLLGKRGKTLPDLILAAWVAVLGVHHLVYVLLGRQVALPVALVNLNAGVPLLQGPFLWMYVRSLTSGQTRLRARDALHLIPFAAFAVYVQVVVRHLGHVGPEVHVFDLSRLVTLAILVSVPAYAVAALVLLRRHRRRTLARHSETAGRDLSWLRWIVLALVAVWVVVIALVLVEALGGQRHRMMTAVTLFIYVIGYFGLRQMAVGEPDPPAEPEPPSAEGAPAGKYRRSGLGPEEIAALVARLERYLDEHQPHRREGLTLREVADDLGVSANHLSQAINQGLGRTFHDLINERRVEEFKRRALDPRNRSYTLLAIALDAGFSSKSSFNRVFKQLTGTTPRRWVESRHEE